MSHNHYLDFPTEKKDFENWSTVGSALIHNNKVIMVPEILDRKGILYNNHPNKFVDSWMFDTEIHLGNEKRTTRGGVGIALMYLRNVEEISSLDSLFGYSNRFDGLGIYLNTILR